MSEHEIKRLKKIELAAQRIKDTWDISDMSRVVPKWHEGELAPNDSLAAGAIIALIHALGEQEA